MKKYFQIGYKSETAEPITERDIQEAFTDAYGIPCCVTVREVPDREEQGKLLEEAVGLLKRIEPNLTPQYPSTGLTPIQAFLTRYEAAKKGNS